MGFTAHIARLLAGFAVLLQVALPFAHANAAASGADLASLLCNPAQRILSLETQAALGELMAAVGGGEDTEAPPNCERCVTPNIAIPAPGTSLADPVSHARAASQAPTRKVLTPSVPRGPPCGLRAPPTFA